MDAKHISQHPPPRGAQVSFHVSFECPSGGAVQNDWCHDCLEKADSVLESERLAAKFSFVKVKGGPACCNPVLQLSFVKLAERQPSTKVLF